MKYAIYGFYFDRDFSFDGIYFKPLEGLSSQERKKIANDRYQHNLTGFINTKGIVSEDFIFKMQAVLSFVQQQDVVIIQDINKSVPEYIKYDFERTGSAPFYSYSDLIEEIVEKLYKKLLNSNDPCNKKDSNDVFGKEHNCEFSSLVYKVTEPFHMRKQFIELVYFLYFSGLEAFCKQYLNSYHPKLYSDKAPEAIGNALDFLQIPYVCVYLDTSPYNLKASVKDEDFIKLSITTYSELRNSLFHSNKFSADVIKSIKKINKKEYEKKEVKITDYDGFLLRLCNAVILKYIDIKNTRLDCSKWCTRSALIK